MSLNPPALTAIVNAYTAWLLQPRWYTLAAVPACTRFINSASGSDTNDGLTPATAWQTLQKLQTALPGGGQCVGISNNSLFDLTDRVSFNGTGGTGLNGASESSRLTITNYDPGGYPNQRPRIRFRYVPTAGQWTWDAAVGAWYYTNPNARQWTRDALIRVEVTATGESKWGSQKSVNGQALVAGLLVQDLDCYSEDTNKRMYLYAPAGTDPTTYYGAKWGAVILGEGEAAALNFSRCGKWVTVDGLVFEDCGLGVQQSNFGGSESLVGFVVQRCAFLNVGRAAYGAQDPTSNYTMTLRLLANTLRGVGGSGIHLYCRALNCEVAGNYASGCNESMSAGGLLYVQEGTGGTNAHGNNIAHSNYIEYAKHNRGLSPYDGAGLYAEIRCKGWAFLFNFLAHMRVGVQNNSGMPVLVAFNVADDVDIPYIVGDELGIGNLVSTWVHNTVVNCRINAYKTPGELGRKACPIEVWENAGAGATFDHRNNIIHLAQGVTAPAAQSIRVGNTCDASCNTISPGFAVAVRRMNNLDVQTATETPAGTEVASVWFGARYEPSGAAPSPAPRLASMPAPRDIYGIAALQPRRGAVSC